MLHPVAGDLRQVVGDEGVGPVVESRRLAEHRDLRRDQLLQLLGIGVGVRLGPAVVQRQAEGLVAHPPLAQGEVRQLSGAVHEVLQVRRPEGPRLARRRRKLGRHLPSRLRAERHPDRLVVPAGRPKERRRHVKVGVRGVHLRIGAVAPVGIEGVGHLHRPVVAGHAPGVRIGTCYRQRLARPVGRRHPIDVLGEFVDRVAAGRGSGHPHRQRPRRRPAEGRRDLRLVVGGVGERDLVVHGRRRAGILRPSLGPRRRQHQGRQPAPHRLHRASPPPAPEARHHAERPRRQQARADAYSGTCRGTGRYQTSCSLVASSLPSRRQ